MRPSEVSSETPQLDATLGGLRRLGHDERRHGRVPDPARHGEVELGAVLAHRVDVADDLVVLPELDEPRDRVQLVGELVRLRPQQLRRAAERADLALEVGELGPVTQRRHRPERPAVLADLHAVHDEHPSAAQHHLVARRPGLRHPHRRPSHRRALALVGDAPQHVPQPRTDRQVVETHPDRMLRQVEQMMGDVVDQRDPLVRVERHHALGETEEHRLTTLGESGDLRRLEPERLPLDPPREQPRPDAAEHQGDAEIGRQVRRVALQAVPGRRHTHGDHDGAELGADGQRRRLRRARRRVEQRALRDEHPLAPDVHDPRPARPLTDGRRAERDAGLVDRRVRRHPRDLVGVRDRHRRHVVLRHDRLHDGRQDVDDAARAHLRAHDRGARELLRDRRDPTALGAGERRVRLRQRDECDGHEHTEEDDHLHDEQLPGEGEATEAARSLRDQNELNLHC